MRHGSDYPLVPAGPRELKSVVAHCRRLVRKRALLAAGVAMVPVPGLDWLTDVAVLAKVLLEINRRFGLTPEQIERLAPDRRVVVYKAISAGGGWLVGKVVTQALVLRVLRLVGVRLTSQQAAKFVPVAGQAVSAALTYSALKFVCDQHIRQCVAVCEQLHGVIDMPPGSPAD